MQAGGTLYPIRLHAKNVSCVPVGKPLQQPFSHKQKITRIIFRKILGLTQVLHQKSIVGCIRYQQSVYLPNFCCLMHLANVPVA
jgi:hypothetical protein